MREKKDVMGNPCESECNACAGCQNTAETRFAAKAAALAGIIWCRFEPNAGWRVENVFPVSVDMLSPSLPDVHTGFASLRLRVKSGLALANIKAGQFCNPRKLMGV